MNYDEFLELVDKTKINFNWRYGQSLMNTLYSIYPEKHDEVINLELDGYYKEDTVPATLKFLQYHWKRKEID
jgi:hypothetical protein